MTNQQPKGSGRGGGGFLNGAWLVLAALALLPSPAASAAEYAISGDSTTFLRMRKTVDKKDTYPLYEYLRFSVSVPDQDGGSTSLNLGAWGRLDLGEKWNGDRSEGDLQYGYLSYQGARNNLLFNAGRQFVVEGVAAERLDGLYLRSDLSAGFSAALFAGTPAVTEPDFNGGEAIYGGRLAHSLPNYYMIGLSALRNEENGDGLREEAGVDLWLHPVAKVDLTGRSSYNSLTSGWMEHAYVVSVAPVADLTASAEFTRVDYNDYFHHVTTNALSLTNGIIQPGEVLTSAGVRASYLPLKNLTVAADYKNYHYRLAGDADLVGGNLSYTLGESFTAGGGLHRMYGAADRLRYWEYRLWALKRMGKVDLAGELFNVNYDRRINGVKNSLALSGSAGYRFSNKLRVWTDLEYWQSPDFDHELRGLVKLAYAFDMTRSEGRGK